MNQTLPPGGASVAPRIIPRADHNVSRSEISPNALRVLYRLKDAGYQAFLVGGCVRDVLIGRHPKDFDVATDALPDQVRDLFRNCRLVGRRFRLAHIVFGREVIEVATFRAPSTDEAGEEGSLVPDLDDDHVDVDGDEDLDDDDEDDDGEDDGDDDAADDEAPEIVPVPPMARRGSRDRDTRAGIDHERVQDDHGRLLRDNIYGTIDQDVWRRDFAANALYYNIADFSIWDYTNGMDDIAARRLRLIGDPETRYREDPVRMLRAARFEAKLDFTLDDASARPIGPLRELLGGVPPARLFDEVQKLFLTGHGERSLAVLRARRLFSVMFPTVDPHLGAECDSIMGRLLRQGLVDTDQRVMDGKPVSPTYLFALLMYGPIGALIEAAPPQRWHDGVTIADCCERALMAASRRVAIPRRIILGVREMYALQPRLEQPRPSRVLRLLEQPRFRAAYDLLLLRAHLGLASPAIAEWWTRLQASSTEDRARMLQAIPAAKAGAGADSEGDADGDGSAPRPRRARRRRSRRGGRGGGTKAE